MQLMYVNSNSKFIRLCGIVMYCVYIIIHIYIHACVCVLAFRWKTSGRLRHRGRGQRPSNGAKASGQCQGHNAQEAALTTDYLPGEYWYFYDGPLGQWWAGWLLSAVIVITNIDLGRSRDVFYTSIYKVFYAYLTQLVHSRQDWDKNQYMYVYNCI